jgi:predicted ABC-type transport system involved in lysophospholipase L1 biosynthesis ATPase subunit
MVTHAREVAERATRIVHMLDGLVDVDETVAA